MTIPIPVLDDRSFDQLVAEAKARIPVHTPEWTNLNDSDPGITIVELFAFLTENLLYRSNRIPEANRIKFLTMLGISLQPASPGNGLVAFSNDRGPLQPPLALPAGTALQAGQVPFLTTDRPGRPARHRGPVLQGAADPRRRHAGAVPAAVPDVPGFEQRRPHLLPAGGPRSPRHRQTRPGGRPGRSGQRHHRPLAVAGHPGPAEYQHRRRARRHRRADPLDRRLPGDADAGRGTDAHDDRRAGRRSRAGLRDRRSRARSDRALGPGLRDRPRQLRPAADHLRRPGPPGTRRGAGHPAALPAAAAVEFRSRGGRHRRLPAPGGRRHHDRPPGDLDPPALPALPDSSATTTTTTHHRDLDRRARPPPRATAPAAAAASAVSARRQSPPYWPPTLPATSQPAASPGSG